MSRGISKRGEREAKVRVYKDEDNADEKRSGARERSKLTKEGGKEEKPESQKMYAANEGIATSTET